MDGAPNTARRGTTGWATPPAERSSYTISQAAALLGVSRVTLWRWIRAGRLPVTRLGHRTTRITHEDLEWALTRPGVNGRAGMRERAPNVDWTAMSESEHFVQFYEADAFLLDAVGEFIGAALRAGDAGVVIATQPHREGLEARFHDAGLELATARARGQYLALDAAETLSRLLVAGAPDPERFAATVGDIITRAAAGGRRVRVFGEMVALLAVEGNHRAAVRLEELWNELRRTHSFALFCAYPMDRLGGEALAELLRDVCAEHGRVIPAESYTALPTPDDRLRAITVLQQKARWLEAEIAARQRAEEELRVALAAERAARQEAEAALRSRDEFLAIAAHELRTPLTSLTGYAQLVRRQLTHDGRLEPERLARALGVITGQAEKLSRLLNQLLDISRLENGKLTLERQPTDLVALVGQVVTSARACTARHTITLDAPPALEAWVDPLRLEQVLTNLLDNAIKYSPDGGQIDVVLTQPCDSPVELSVRDRGLGIPPEKRGRIFERFYQAHANGHRGGWGLGLYISRQIVELHGGEITAEFPPAGGTCFLARLPAGLDRPVAPGAA